MSLIKRIPNETVRQYAALCAFAYDGLDRSLPKLAESEHIVLPTLRSWSARFNWRDRVENYDLELIERQQNAQDLALASKIADWTQRQDALRELEFEMALRLIKRAREFWKIPALTFKPRTRSARLNSPARSAAALAVSASSRSRSRLRIHFQT